MRSDDDETSAKPALQERPTPAEGPPLARPSQGPSSVPVETPTAPEQALEAQGNREALRAPWGAETAGSAAATPEAAFQQIAQALLADRAGAALPIVGVTSALAGEGKSTIALGLARTLAALQTQPVTLVECHLTRPVFHQWVPIPAAPGLAEVVRGECPLATGLYQIGDQCFVLPAGDSHHDALGLLKRVQRTNLLHCLAESGTLLVLDLPAVLPGPEGEQAASLAEALLLVVRAGQTPQGQVKAALARLDATSVRGIVLNAASPSLPAWLRETPE